MSNFHFNYGRRQTLGIEPKNEEKVFIKIPLESGGFWEKEYLQNDLIGTVINDFKTENHVDIPKDYFMDWNCKNKSLKMSDKIRSLIVPEVPTICFNPEMKKKPLQIQEKDIIPQVIGKPFNEPFEVFLLKKSDKILKIQTYDENIIEKLGLNDYSPSSAYCNGNNHLFISGGETKNNEIIDKLWQIDLENNNINKPINIPPKKNHSMIFIPPGYVFVVGGNDKKTFYLENENQEVYEWADLNVQRSEPALQRVGSTLYCFDNVNKMDNDQLTFEKTELNSKNPKWILLNPKLDQSIINGKLPQKFFGVSKDLEDNIIFLGGNMDYYNDGNKLINYKYNPKDNTIYSSEVPYKDFNLKEKTFLPYNKNIDYILPDFNKQHPEVIFYVKNKSKVEKVNYKPNTNPNKKNLLRGARHPLLDSKYDFNMPAVAIPLPENLNENIKLKSEPQKHNYISPYASGDIHEPSFQEYDYNLNYKIEQPPPFKEPEIEANIGDQRLSIDIPNEIIESSRSKIKDSVKISIKEEEKNENDHNTGKIKLKYVPRPPTDYNRQLYTQIPMYNNELTIPRFHYSVNDPGNELNITSKGKIYTSYIPREPARIKASHADFNIKSSKLEKDDLILPNYNYSVNIGMDKDYRGNSPRNLVASARNAKFGGNIDGEILSPNIHMPKSESVNLNVVGINTPEYKVSEKLPGIDAKAPKININGEYLDDFELKGIIPGTKDINLKGGKVKIPNYSLSGKIPGTNVNSKANLKSPNINIKGPNINGPDFNLSGNIPGGKIGAPNIDLKSPNIDFKGPNIDLKEPNLDLKGPNINLKGPKMDLKGPNIKEQDFDLKGDINIKGPDYKLNGSIDGINVDTPKIDMPKGNINLKGPKIKTNYKLEGDLPGYNLIGIIPGMKKSSSNIDIKGQRRIPDYNFNAKAPNVNLKSQRIHLHSPDVDIKGSRKIIEDTSLSGVIPGINLKSSNIDLPSGNINLKGPNINGPDYNLKGDLPGMKINAPNINLKGPNINGPEYNLKGDIPGMKINAPNIDIKGPNINGPDFNLKGDIPGVKLNSPNIDIKGRNVNVPDYNLKGDIPGMKINVPNTNIKSPNVDIKGPDFNLNGDIPGVSIKEPKIDLPSGNINLKGPKLDVKTPKVDLIGPNTNFNMNGIIPGMKINSPNIDVKGPDYNLNGDIPRIKLNAPNIDIKGPNVNGPDYNLKGDIPGVKLNAPNIDIKGPNVNGPDFNLKGDIPGIKLNAPNIDIKGPNVNAPEFNLKGDLPGVKLNAPNIDIKGPNIKGPDYNLKGDIPGIKLNSPNIDIKGPNVNCPDYNLKGDIPGMKINVPNVNIKSPNVDIKGPDFNLNGDIPGVNIKEPKIDMPSGNINFKGPKLKSPNINLKGSSDYNLVGNIPGINVKGPNFKGVNYELSGNIPGINSKNKDYSISGVIPSYTTINPNLEIKNYKITQPNIKYSTIDADANIKTSFNPNLKASVNSNRRISPGKKNFHGGLNDPNYLEYSDIKGSRRALFSSQIDDVELSKKIDKNKFNVSGNKIIDEQDVILQDPFNINNQILLQNQNPGNRKSIHLVVSQLQIQPEQQFNQVIPPKANIDLKPPEIEINKKDLNLNNNLDIKGGDIEIKAENDNNLGNLGNINIKLNDKEHEGMNIKIPNIEIKNDINLKQDIPKVDIKNDINLKENIPSIEIEEPQLKGKINLKKKEPTNLRFRPIKEDEDDKYGINININNKKDDENSSNSKEEKAMNSEKLNSVRKKKGLPMVGIKNNNFKSSKIEVGGKLDVNNIDVDNLKTANVGVNGMKLGERIIE